jgi:hypothetical protein
MADNVRKRGFHWYKSLGGSACPLIETHPVASAWRPTLTVTTPFYMNLRPGDPVVRLSTGYMDIAGGSESDTKATAIYGICAGFVTQWDGSRMVFRDYYPNEGVTYGTNFARQTYIKVYPVRGALFEVDVADKTTATTYAAYLAFIGENADHVLDYNNANNDCDTMLDISSHNTTSTLQWRLMKVEQNNPENQDFSGSYVKLVVQCNIPQEPVGSSTGV